MNTWLLITAVPRNCLDLSKLNVVFHEHCFIFGRENSVRFFGNFVERPNVGRNFYNSMYKYNFDFTTPNDETIAWRYMDFTKFADLLDSKKLYLCRSDKFDDPYEGYLKLQDSHSDELETFEKTKKYYFISCWHLNNFQSDAMWRIFISSKNGIAIKTSVGSIKKAIEISKDDVFIGQVFYRDFENMNFFDIAFEKQNVFPGAPGGSINQFTYKRKSFEHENELRLVYVDLPIPHASKLTLGHERPILEFKKIDVDLKSLVQEVIISPFAEIGFKDSVSKLVSDSGLSFRITESNLYKK